MAFSAIVAAPAVIGIEAVSIVVDLPRVVGSKSIKNLSLKIEKLEKIAMLAVSSLNTISSLIAKALSDDSIGDHVRITKKTFDQGYTQRWTEKVFTISKIQWIIPVHVK